MSRIDFSIIANNYEEYSLVQKSAADTLLKLLDVRNGDDVLDLGCGAGNLTDHGEMELRFNRIFLVAIKVWIRSGNFI